jgi:Fe-S-cluster containining protein
MNAPTKMIVINEKPRECGGCTLCCKVMGIQEGEFHKPKDEWCPHTKKGTGCGCYSTRPTKCRDFSCMWLTGQFGQTEHRPDKIHGVVIPTTDGRNWVIIEDPGYEGFARQVLKPAITLWLDRGMEHYVIVVCGKKRSFNGDSRTFQKLMADGAPEVLDAQAVTAPRRR